MKSVDHLSASQARRIALAAAGFGQAQRGAVSARRVHDVIRRLGQLQIDSVNVFERAHYLPLFSRLGTYPKRLLDDSAGTNTIEYWPHQAGIIPSEDWPLWQWRRDDYREARNGAWIAEHRALADWVLAELATHGPMTSGQFAHEQNRSRGAWWGWSDVKIALENLWRVGEVVCVRRRNFERLYELPSTLPTAAQRDPVAREDAQRVLFERAAKALGVGTDADLADYWRVRLATVKPFVQEMIERGALIPTAVEGWTAANGRPMAAWRHRDAPAPRRMELATLLSPFDPLVWFRPRAERLFNFAYRIEIYTPAERREFGYYSLPVLVGDAVVGRVDLKSNRSQRTLMVQSAWAEAHAPKDLGERMPAVLNDAAHWQGLEQIVTTEVGSLAGALPRRFQVATV